MAEDRRTKEKSGGNQKCCCGGEGCGCGRGNRKNGESVHHHSNYFSNITEILKKSDSSVDVRRRELFKLFGKTSVALGTLALLESCVRKPEPEKLLPYLNVPENIIPGVPYWFATVCSGCPAGCGILVKTEDAIPRKIEGNPDHPISGGKTCARGQAIIHQLYSPDRLKFPLERKKGELARTSLDSALRKLVEKIKGADPKKVFLITENITGKTEKLYLDFASALGIPQENIIRWETFSFAPLRKATEIVFGESKVPIFRIDNADFIVSFGADFLDTYLSTVLYSRWFAKAREVDEERGKRKSRFIFVGARMPLTGLNADKWISVKPGGEVFFAISLFNKIIEKGLARVEGAETLKIELRGDLNELAGVDEKKVEKLAEELGRAKSPICIPPHVGDENVVALAVVVYLINYVLGVAGKNMIMEPGFSYEKLASAEEISKLVEKAERGEIEVLIIHSFDPVYSSPEFVGLRRALKKIPFVVSLTYHEDETLEYSHLVIPDRHPLEKWGDSEPIKGVIGLRQPVISPLYKETIPAEDLLIKVANSVKPGTFPQDFKEYLKNEYALGEEEWVRSLERGGIFNFELKEHDVSLRPAEEIKSALSVSIPKRGEELSLLIYPSYHLYDGRVANSPWILEFFDVATRLSWRNALELSPSTAKRLGLKNGDIVEVKTKGVGKIELPVIIYPGVREGVGAISVGWGHTKYGRFASGRGVNPLELVSKLTPSGEPSFIIQDVEVRKTGRRMRRLPENEGVPRRLGRDTAHFTTLKILPKESREEKLKEYEKILKARFPRGDWEKYGRDSGRKNKYRWKMVIDLDKCIGCSACMIACRVENNIPFVGEDEVIRGREITWIRVERYWLSQDELKEVEESMKNGHGKGHKGKHHSYFDMLKISDETAKAVFVPMLCQHCEYAPCEYVCPVYATMHTSDGLNAQIYNRCVGTRFCANNCPYKVRYFNFHDYFENVPEPLNMFYNPDVTVRSKGVMEKCTFCIQRINYALRTAKIEGRDVRDGEIVPACAQVCPTDAIIFGNIKDEESQVVKAQESRRVNWSLKELGVEPSVAYLEKVFDTKIEEELA